MTFDPLCTWERYEALQMFVISFSDKPKKMAKNVDVFSVAFGQNIEYGRG